MSFMFTIFLITLIGSFTVAGALIAYRFKQKEAFLPISLGLVIGTMLYLAFMVILPEGISMAYAFSPENLLETNYINILVQVSFFSGIIILFFLEKIIPKKYDIHHIHSCENNHCNFSSKTIIIFLLVILIHNIPEGFSILVANLGENKGFGIIMLIGVALHNLPQGFSLAVLFIANNINRKNALTILFITGLSQPIGAVLGYLIFGNLLLDSFSYGLLLILLAGMIVFLCMDHLLQLLIDSLRKGHHNIHKTSIAIIIGMFLVSIPMMFEEILLT